MTILAAIQCSHVRFGVGKGRLWKELYIVKLICLEQTSQGARLNTDWRLTHTWKHIEADIHNIMSAFIWRMENLNEWRILPFMNGEFSNREWRILHSWMEEFSIHWDPPFVRWTHSLSLSYCQWSRTMVIQLDKNLMMAWWTKHSTIAGIIYIEVSYFKLKAVFQVREAYVPYIVTSIFKDKKEAFFLISNSAWIFSVDWTIIQCNWCPKGIHFFFLALASVQRTHMGYPQFAEGMQFVVLKIIWG